MMAMQYSFTLPADYDMQLIRKRIADKAHLFDRYPDLVFKAFLHADRGTRPTGSPENLYAPLYVWDNSEGMNRFLASEGFAALTKAFGWPSIKLWSVWHSRLTEDATAARHATREIVAIAPHASLAALREREDALAQDAFRQGALGAVVAFEPGTWSLVRLRLWRDIDAALDQANVQRYEVGHMSFGPIGSTA